MNPGDLCICGHTREVHFGHECSTVGENSPIYRLGLGRGIDCRCKQFVELGLAVEIFEALKKIAAHPVGYGETFNGSAEMGARPVCHECQQKVAIASRMLAKTRES